LGHKWRGAGIWTSLWTQHERGTGSTTQTDARRDSALERKAALDEDLGSDYYAHFTARSARASSRNLEELGEDTGLLRVAPSREGVQIVARLDSASTVRQGQEAKLCVDTSQLYLFDSEGGRSLLRATPVQPGALRRSPALSTYAGTPASARPATGFGGVGKTVVDSARKNDEVGQCRFAASQRR
jgi:hypothetical protein